MAVKAASPGLQKFDTFSSSQKSPREGVKDRPITAEKNSSTPTRRKVVFQTTLNRPWEKEGIFNLPEDRSSYLPLTLAADSPKSSAAAAEIAALAGKSATAFSSALVKPSSSNVLSQNTGVTDTDIERRHKSLKDAAWHWASENFPPPSSSSSFNDNNGAVVAAAAANDASSSPRQISDVLQLCKDHPQLAEYVNYLASCPRDQTWEDFFNTRKTFLAFAVLSKVLEVHIFGQEMFGASEAQVKVLRALDLEMMHQDGFARQVARATIINSLLSTHDKALPPNFWPALTELQARITALVSPLQQPPDPPSSFHESLSYILLSAACLSLDMRRKPSAIYYMRPVTRESALDSSTTHVLNSDRFAHDQIYHDEFHEPIVRIAAWPIVDVYRPSRSNPSSSSPSSSERDEGDSDSDSSDSSHFFNDNYKNNPKRQSGLSVRRICKGEAYVE